MKTSLIIICLFVQVSYGQTTFDYIKDIEGQWKGTLTYTDFQDDTKQTTLNCTMKSEWKKKKGIISIAFEEPNGKIYSDRMKIKSISKGEKIKFDGVVFNIQKFDFNPETQNWTLVIEAKGKDNRKPAIIKQTIVYEKEKLSISKEIKYLNSKSYFIRNKYYFAKE